MQQDLDGKKITLEELAAYPKGSLGSAFHAFLVENNFSPNEFTMHDIIHVITGVEPKPAGEEVAIVYDYVLKDIITTDVNENQIKRLDMCKITVAQLRAAIPSYAAEINEELKPYRVASNSEIEQHYLAALVMNEDFEQKTGKKFKDTALLDLLALDNAMFDEYRETIKHIRDSDRNKDNRIRIYPTSPADMETLLQNWILGASSHDGLNLDDFTGVSSYANFPKTRDSERDVGTAI